MQYRPLPPGDTTYDNDDVNHVQVHSTRDISLQYHLVPPGGAVIDVVLAIQPNVFTANRTKLNNSLFNSSFNKTNQTLGM